MYKELLRPAWMEINLDNFVKNLQSIQNRIGPDRTIMGIVKADAYGHGAVTCSKVMLQNGITHLAVATLQEALELREGGIDAPICMLGIVPALYADVVIEHDIIPIISDVENAEAFSKEAVRQGKTVSFLIAVDTGMGRIGFPVSEKGADDIKTVSELPHAEIMGIMSHFSSADLKDLAYSYWQLDGFQEMLDMLKRRCVDVHIRSMANSPSMYRIPESYFDSVRPGAMLWGFYPNNITNPQDIPILPVMSVKTNITYIKKVPANTSISYGRLFTTERDSIIATLPIGYADGMTRMLQGNRIRSLVHGEFAPILGTICMDQCMIDVTDIPGVEIGDEVVLLGKQGENEIPIKELCEISGMCCGELWYNFSKRLPRMYTGTVADSV